MKYSKQLLIGSVLFAVSASPLYAGSNNDNVTNGRPFQDLLSRIEANEAMIVANQGDVDALGRQVDALQGSVDSAYQEMEGLISRVSSNEESIETVISGLADLNRVSSSLAAQFNDLAENYHSDIAAMQADIDAMGTRIDELSGLVANLSNELASSVLALNSAVDENSIAIDSLLLQVVTLNAEVTGINSDINLLQNNTDNLSSRLELQTAQLADIEFRLQALENMDISIASAAASTSATITLETLNTGCGGNSTDITLTVNGAEVINTPSNGNQCSCSGTITEASSSSIALNARGENSMTYNSEARPNTYFAWSRAVVDYSDGSSETVCIFDVNGGNCTATNLCSAGYLHYTAINESASF